MQHRFEVVRERTGEGHEQEVMRLKHSGWEALEEQKQAREEIYIYGIYIHNIYIDTSYTFV